MLRLTGSRAHLPWASADSGRVFRDQRRTFTTATVGAALAEAAGLAQPAR
jgi:hypothetical protein